MKSAALAKLQRLLDMASAAEASRFAGVMAKAAACRDRAEKLRAEIDGVGQGAIRDGDRQVASDLVAGSRWRLRLAERARAEGARAGELEVEAEKIRPRLARAFGREAAAAAIAEEARVEERRLAALRAEANVVAPVPNQPGSSDSEADETSAGSPGIA